MKRNAIVRIIFYSIGILVLLGILLQGLGFSLYSFESEISEQHHQIAPNQTIGQNFPTHSIEKIDIDWAAGSITIAPESRLTDISVCESGPSNYPMVCTISGDTLRIRFAKEGKFHKIFGSNLSFKKDLVILVPDQWLCDTLQIASASADVYMQDMTINEFDFDGASGRCTIENCVIGDVDLDTASGDLSFTGSLNTLDCDSVSADCVITVTNVPHSIDLDAVSGDLKLYLPEYCGFTCSLDGMSGNFRSEYETSMKNGHHVYGDGSCKIEVDAMSGSVKIHKHTAQQNEHHPE